MPEKQKGEEIQIRNENTDTVNDITETQRKAGDSYHMAIHFIT